MNKSIFRAAIAAGWIAFLPAGAQSQITGTTSPNPALISVSASGQVSLQLNPASASIDGISGELHYDPAALSNFSVAAGPGAAGFVVDGFSSVPGIFAFVVYKAVPGGPLDLSDAVVKFGFDKAPGGPATPLTVTYAMDAAAQITNQGLGDVISVSVASPNNPSPQIVAFGSFDVLIANAVMEWSRYE